MKIYIASSWKNQHAVEMLTALLRAEEHEVLSFVENNYGENPDLAQNKAVKELPFDMWVWSEWGTKSFVYDTEGAMYSDLVIYISPSGKDAAAECGMAFARKIPMFMLYSKGEDFGLMRRMFDRVCTDFRVLLDEVEQLASGQFVR